MRLWLMLAVGLVPGLVGCTGGDLVDQPLVATETTSNVLASAEQPSGAKPIRRHNRAPLLVTKMRPQLGERLEVSGQVRRRHSDSEEPIGPALFRLTVDGREVVRRRLATEKPFQAFAETVDLSRFADREVEVELQLENSNGKTTVAYWNRVAVERGREVRRRKAEEGSNVLIALVDTLRADRCSLYGHGRRTTPCLEKMADTGLLFEQAVSPSSWTLPSVAALMTGVHPVEHQAANGRGLNHQELTLAEVALGTGVTTMAVSSNPLIGPGHAFDQGFETFIHPSWARADTVVDEFLNWLDRAEETQWFAYLHFMDPHDPYEAPRPWAGTWTDPQYQGPFTSRKALNRVAEKVNYGEPPPFDISDDDLQYLRASYDEEILYWDATFRRLMEELRRRGLDEQTVVVVTADHGEEFADHGKFKHGQHLYQESVHVPLLVAGPSVPRGERRSGTVAIRHLGGTVLRLLGVEPSKGFAGDLLESDSADLGPVVTATRYTISPDDPRTRRGMVGLYHDRWKLIRELDIAGEELYDIARDPGELEDLATAQAESKAAMSAALGIWMERRDVSWKADVKTALPADTEERLRALGYIR